MFVSCDECSLVSAGGSRERRMVAREKLGVLKRAVLIVKHHNGIYQTRKSRLKAQVKSLTFSRSGTESCVQRSTTRIAGQGQEQSLERPLHQGTADEDQHTRRAARASWLRFSHNLI